MTHSLAHMASSQMLVVLVHVLFICSTVSSDSDDTFVENEEHFNGNLHPSKLMDLTGDDTEANVGWIVSRSTWGAQMPIGVLDVNVTPLERVIVASSGTKGCFTLPTCALQMRYLQKYAIESELWFDHPFNYMIGGDGRVYVGRGWDYMAAHTKHNNNRTLGVAFIGQFDFQMPNFKQLRAFDRLLATGVKIGKLSPDYKLQGQCQLRPDNSPGLTLIASMRYWPHYDNSLPQRCTYGQQIITGVYTPLIDTWLKVDPSAEEEVLF